MTTTGNWILATGSGKNTISS